MIAVGSIWAFPTSEGCSPAYARVESVKGGTVHTTFAIVDAGRTFRRRQKFDAKTFAKCIANGSLTPAQVSL